MYPDADDKWWVSHTPGEKSGYLHNPIPCKVLDLHIDNDDWRQRQRWQYADPSKRETWQDDRTLIVSRGPLPPLPMMFNVTATGAAANARSFLGVFTRTQRWWNGRPVYSNTQGRVLHHGDLGWDIGPAIGYSLIRGSRSHHSPVSEENWRCTVTDNQTVSVTVTETRPSVIKKCDS